MVTTPMPFPDMIDLNILQYAAVKKIEIHDALYIFDEVGTGKTIQAGMIIHKLLHVKGALKKKRILIITAPNVRGQFMDELEQKFDIKSVSDKYSVTVINNYYSNIEQQSARQIASQFVWDLVVVDEAHLFLHKNTKRRCALAGVRSKKVVLMTGTPIRDEYEDLLIYPQMAIEILGVDVKKQHHIHESYQQATIPWAHDAGLPIILGLNLNSPVSRNFKEMLEIVDIDEQKAVILSPRNRNVQIWEYDAISNKSKTLIVKIRALLTEENKADNRIVIFCTKILSVEYVYNLLKDIEISGAKISCERLTGKYDLQYRNEQFRKWSKLQGEELPKVLILTSGIGGVGLNLPGYNYVVNYDIPISPANLEQRFGRIDRYDNPFPEITNVFLIPPNGVYNTDSNNFQKCIAGFIYDVLPALPSKNNILTDEVLERYLSRGKWERECIGNFMELIKNKEENTLIFLYNLYIKISKYIKKEDQNEAEKYDFFGVKTEVKFITSKVLDNLRLVTDAHSFEEFVQRLASKLEKEREDTIQETNIPTSGQFFYKTVNRDLFDNYLPGHFGSLDSNQN